MTERTELIRLEHVRKRYGRQSVLAIDDLTLREGDRVMLSGSNGSGKSTLLKLLAGVIPADGGRVHANPAFGREPLGFVPQQGGLYGDLTVGDNLRLRRTLYGVGPVNVRSGSYVDALGLTPLLGKRFSELSGGYQRLAAFACALHVDPRWLLLDEPFSGLDARHVEVLLQEIDRVDRRLLVVAAPTGDSLPSANRFIEIEAGEIRW
jgi:ABC-type multidrug transport system ATPase subunit